MNAVLHDFSVRLILLLTTRLRGEDHVFFSYQGRGAAVLKTPPQSPITKHACYLRKKLQEEDNWTQQATRAVALIAHPPTCM